MSAWSILKTSADKILKVVIMTNHDLDKIGIIVGKGENAKCQ